MIENLSKFFTSEPVVALLATLLLFLITVILVAKRYIGGTTAFVLLLLSLLIGTMLNDPRSLTPPSFRESASYEVEKEQQFKEDLLHAFDALKGEVDTEKSKLSKVKEQMVELVSKLEAEKEKLDKFIDETTLRLDQLETKAFSDDETKNDGEGKPSEKS